MVSHTDLLSYRDPKAVNAWFANKRSVTKKKFRGLVHPYGTPPPRSHVDDYHPQYHPHDMSQDHSRRSTPLSFNMDLPNQSPQPDNRHVFDSEISTGVPRRMRIRAQADHRDAFDVELAHGSLLVMSHASQLTHEHGIPKTARPVGPRMSAVFRVRPPR